jgi:ATP-dependent RNA circularization protein (DNA/RNA ligase family)
MTAHFFRFPHTPHLAWLEAQAPRDDKVLSPLEADKFLAHDLVVEEKIDGANLGLSVDANGQLLAQSRGQYLQAPFTGQFTRLSPWFSRHSEALASALNGQHLILFGEWCAARHSLDYDQLPNWYLVFDVYDQDRHHFWSSRRRNALASLVGLPCAPQVAAGRFSVAQLQEILTTRLSHYRSGPMEGLVVRHDVGDACEARAKLVCPHFTQAMGPHWRKRRLEWNSLRTISAPH